MRSVQADFPIGVGAVRFIVSGGESAGWDRVTKASEEFSSQHLPSVCFRGNDDRRRRSLLLHPGACAGCKCIYESPVDSNIAVTKVIARCHERKNVSPFLSYKT